MCRKGARKWIYRHSCTTVSKQRNLSFGGGRFFCIYYGNINWYAMKSSRGSKELRLTIYFISFFNSFQIYASYFYGMMCTDTSVGKKIMWGVTTLTFLLLKIFPVLSQPASAMDVTHPKSLELCSGVKAEQSYWQEIASAVVHLDSIWLGHSQACQRYHVRVIHSRVSEI